MITLQGLWRSDAGLCVWGEDSSLPPIASPRRGRPPARPGPRRHPFACPPEILYDAVGRLAMPPESFDATEITLLLPSTATAPQASPALLREDDVDIGPLWGVTPWTVPGLSFDADSAFDFLMALPQGAPPGVAIGDSLRAFAQIAVLGLELVARGRVLPGLERRGNVWTAVWNPAPDDGDDAERVGLLTAALPPVCRAEYLGSPEGRDPAAVVNESLGGVVDALVRSSLKGRALDRQQTTAAELWRDALCGADAVVDADDADLELLQKELDEWAYPARPDRGFRTCFRLGEPDAEDERWRLEFALQATDDRSLLVPAEVVWSSTGGRIAALGRTIDDPHELLLEDLGRAARLWPDIEGALEDATPTGLDLSARGAHRFLSEAVALLQQGGFGVLVPPWWKQHDAGLKAKLTVTPRDAAAVQSSGRFGLDQICDYDWRVAIGGVELTERDLRRLAALKTPLVNFRGRWIELTPEDIDAALALFARGTGEMTVGDAMRAGLGLPPNDVGLEVAEVEANGWLNDLLAADPDARMRAAKTPRGFAGKLRPYQERGLAWLSFLGELGLGACLADDMGLGKTAQLLALLVAERNREESPGPTLVICPMSVVGNWQREAERFTPALTVLVHHGSERLAGADLALAAEGSDVVITTYQVAARDRAALGDIRWLRVVLDEAQNIKNSAAKQAQAVRSLPAAQRVALTGTPVENRLSELWSIMEFLNAGLLGSAKSFRERFAVPIERYRNDAAAQDLKRMTAPFILRRVKTDKRIIKDLPDKIEMKVPCNLTREQASLYQAVVDDMLEQVDDAEGIQRKGLVLSTITKLKQVCNHPAQLLKDRSAFAGRSGKLVRLEEILEEVLAEGDKAICFTQFADIGHRLKSHLQERFGHPVLFLHGGARKKARDEMVTRFQHDDGPPLFVVSLKAGGTGLNLTAATHVIHFDRWWNPAVEDQATDRAFRIGQTRNVQVRKFVCTGTLEERIDELIESKKDLAARIVGAGESWLTELSTAELKEVVALSAAAVED